VTCPRLIAVNTSRSVDAKRTMDARWANASCIRWPGLGREGGAPEGAEEPEFTVWVTVSSILNVVFWAVNKVVPIRKASVSIC
jgi:hypothetical protein